MAKIGPKEARLADLRSKGQVPKHVEMMLHDGAPLETVVLPGDPPRTNSTSPRTGVVSSDTLAETKSLSARVNLDAQAAKNTAKANKAVDKPAVSPTSKPTPAASGTTLNEETMKTTTAKKASKPNASKPKSTERRKASAKSNAARTPVDKKPKAPKGHVVKILELASRANGVSRAELIALTKWQGAPWKWLFKNSKGTGYCDRWGYSLKVIEGKDGETRYHVEKKASAK